MLLKILSGYLIYQQNSTPIPIPMFNAQFYNEAPDEPLLRLSYGSFINPSYEDLVIRSCKLLY